LKREILAADFFRYPTISSFARHLAGVHSATVTPRRTAAGGRAEIAIIGMAGRFPNARNIEAFWENLAAGIDCVTDFTREQLEEAGVDRTLLDDPAYVKSAPVLEDAGMFAASFFGYSPREASRMDPQQRLFLEACWEALEHAGYAPGTFDGPISLFGGSTINTYGLARCDVPSTLDMDFVSDVMSLDKDFLTTRISYKLDLKGPSVNVQTACSTGLVAVHMACLNLLAGESDLALAGAFSVRVPHPSGHLYQPGGIFSAGGRCRSFDAEADGTLLGSGGGVVVLKRLSDAVADNDTIHAVIKSSAINNDGALKAGYTAPGVEGQINVLRAALSRAAVSPDTISYVEAHGSATALGDAIEVAALGEVFGPRADPASRCALGTVKTNIGHLDAAAGIAVLIKTVLMLEHRTIPPNLHFKKPNPKLKLDESPFYIPTTSSSWPDAATPRRAGVSAFGIGGTNAHVVLEEAPTRAVTSPTSQDQLLVLSAKSSSALEQARLDLAAHLRAHPELDLADVAYTLQRGRQSFTHRCALVCHSLEDAANALSSPTAGRLLTASPAEICHENPQRAIEGEPVSAPLHVSSRSSLLAAVGRLYVEHATIDWSAVCGGEQRRRIPLPTYPFERQRYWIDPPQRRGARPARMMKNVDPASWLTPDAFSTIARWTPHQLDEHLRPKVGGLLSLHEVLPDALDFCVVCSSLSSVVGGLGLCAYAAANLIMDASVERLRQKQRPGMTHWLSLNWDYWQPEYNAFGGTSAASFASERTDLALTPAEGIEVLTRALSVREAIPRIVISTANLDARLDRLSRTQLAEKRKESAPERGTSVSAPRPAEASVEQRSPEELIAAIWRDILGVDAVGMDEDFFQLGGDSFDAIRLVDRLKEDLGVEIPVHELFRSPTIAQLLARWPPPSPRSAEPGKKAIAGDLTVAAASLRSDQFALPQGATIDEKKRHMRNFYDTVTDQLAASDLCRHSFFLNFGYEPDGQSQDEARIHISEHQINSRSIRLVHEVLGDCLLGADCEVLDAGCGRGGTISQIQQHFPLTRITGIDLSPRAIAFCRENHGASNTRFVEADAEAMPFPDRSFDVVLNIESSHSYPDIDAFYREVRRVLRPGGHFLYADLFPVEQWETLRKQLRAAGLTCLHERDITANVLRACDRVAARRIHAFAADNDAAVLANFLAVPGSRLYNEMTGGRSSYRILKLARIESPSQVRAAHEILVQLQPGDQARRPLFLVHPIGGTVFHYQALAHHLGNEAPVFGLRASGLERGEEFDGDIERMASRYVDAIQARQPKGSYLLGGWSFGGLVAYEMARRLREQGGKVDLLVLLDTPAPGDLPADLDQFVPQRPSDLPDAPAFARVLRQNLDAMRRYRARRYTGNALLLRAAQWPAALRPVSEKRWKGLIDGKLESIEVQANHFTMMASPHIEMLAEQVRHALARERFALSVPPPVLIR
jgi:3-oxoacyl-(acyl-carrier-protein) synthase/thioesterase domain-containing protein/SAM-dependent methyltransferase/acyl carrier protein